MLKPDGTVYRAGLPAGSIDKDGRIVVNETYAGDLKPEGRLFTASGKEIGRIDGQGRIFFRDAEFIRIYPKGPISRVLDAKHVVPWGKYAPTKTGYARLKLLAAVIMFWQTGLDLEK